MQNHVAAGDLMTDAACVAPPSAHQDPNTNSTCQQNGLKYHSPPGKPGRFQPNCRALEHSAIEPSIVRFGRRSSSHSTGGKKPISTIYSVSTSRVSGYLYSFSPDALPT